MKAHGLLVLLQLNSQEMAGLAEVLNFAVSPQASFGSSHEIYHTESISLLFLSQDVHGLLVFVSRVPLIFVLGSAPAQC